MTVNPFRYVNSLHTFVSDVAQHIRNGDDIVIITGPYDVGEIEEVLPDLCAYDPACVSHLHSSRELVADGVYRGLYCVRLLDEPLGGFRNRCAKSGLKVILSPTGASSDELGGYGIALTRDVKSDSYRSATIRLAAEVSAGSVYSFRELLAEYAKSELRRNAFVNPLKAATKVGEDQAKIAASERSYALDEMSAFASFLVTLADGSSSAGKEDVQSTFLWAWSRGMCWRQGGIWCLDWSLISHIAGIQTVAFDTFNGETRTLIDQIMLKRIGAAETTVMMPVLDKYCSIAASRFVRQSCRNDNSSIATCSVKRSTQISDMRDYSKQYQDRWNDYVECSINMHVIRELRNYLCHLNPQGITDRELIEFRKVLEALNQVEQMPYDESSACAFM